MQEEEVFINPAVFETKFTCDLKKCKGACCTMESEYGAPLYADEVVEIEKVLEIVKEYLPENHLRELERTGFYEEKEGHLMTRSFDNKACLFVYYDDKIAKCAIEKAYFENKIDFRKPVSCHLFPIRISEFGGKILRFENYGDCGPALELGKQTGITVFEFCKDALVREFDAEWYQMVKDSLEK